MWNDILINIFEDGFFAAIAAIGFSSISNTPRCAYLTLALIAAAGHAIRYVLTLPDFGGMHIILEKPRTIDPLQQVRLTPESKIELTPCV